jgi:hypothetical protein
MSLEELKNVWAITGLILIENSTTNNNRINSQNRFDLNW